MYFFEVAWIIVAEVNITVVTNVLDKRFTIPGNIHNKEIGKIAIIADIIKVMTQIHQIVHMSKPIGLVVVGVHVIGEIHIILTMEEEDVVQILEV